MSSQGDNKNKRSFCAGAENDSKLSNLSAPKDDSIEPSECKIPKTESGDSETIEQPPCEVIEVKVVYNKKKYDVSAPVNTTIPEFKKQLQNLLGKVVFHCLLRYAYHNINDIDYTLVLFLH